MENKDLIKLASDFFNHYPLENTCYVTSDGTPFASKNKQAADSHAKQNELFCYEFKRSLNGAEVAEANSESTESEALVGMNVKEVTERLMLEKEQEIAAVKEALETELVDAKTKLANQEADIKAMQETASVQSNSYNELNTKHLESLKENEALKAEIEALKAKKK